MERKRFKMIYLKEIKAGLNNKLYKDLNLINNKKIKKEIQSEKIRILGHYFVEKNKNKAKLIINNKKYILNEFIEDKKFKDDKIKISIILNKELLDLSYMFENCYKLEQISFYENKIFIDN